MGSDDGQAFSERSITLSNGFAGVEIAGRTIFVDKLAGPNADGSLARPFNNIAGSGVANAFGVARPNDIVRIVGNGGTDQNLATVPDNFAYEVGFGTSGGPAILQDGAELAVPRGVTLMIDPGAVFKLRRSWIGIGSSSLTVDRSGGSIQVLGTPDRNVFFTSWLDESIGRDTFAPTTTPFNGDWGGLIFRADLDNAESRRNLENEGIFLNYVNHADIRYGGGSPVINSIQQIVNPIQLLETRPTISFNRITNSADSAISATPNTFDETNFLAPRFQIDGAFTSDYERIGPDIHANTLLGNSTNGLFIKVETPAGGQQRALTVSGRFDDTDIVHVLAENLIIEGSPGEPFLDLEKPSVDQITDSPRTGGVLAPGTYRYKVTFVDVNGFEGRPSEPTAAFLLTDPNDGVPLSTDGNALQLNQLPPTTGDFVSRRIYRTDGSGSGVYRLVAEIDAKSTVFVDRGLAFSTVLQRDPPDSQQITLTASLRGSLAPGIYNYRIVFVDAQGREGASSDPTQDIALAAMGESGVVLTNLPAAEGQFVTRRIYRSQVGGINPYSMV
ncbi:MAG: hypothetical protein HYV60_02765, partial [Planctomycetia bacterium]|nr:hypothetical protein [Planctomycetia bacterium]